VDPATALIGAIAAFLAALAFVLRAAAPYVTALGKSAADDRAALDAARRHIRILEDRANAHPHE
jgi:hypothetical protein